MQARHDYRFHQLMLLFSYGDLAQLLNRIVSVSIAPCEYFFWAATLSKSLFMQAPSIFVSACLHSRAWLRPSGSLAFREVMIACVLDVVSLCRLNRSFGTSTTIRDHFCHGFSDSMHVSTCMSETNCGNSASLREIRKNRPK